MASIHRVDPDGRFHPLSEYDGLWIQKAIKRPGALRAKVGKLTKKGTIPVGTLNELAKKKGLTGQQARLAKTLRRISRRHSAAKKAAKGQD